MIKYDYKDADNLSSALDNLYTIITLLRSPEGCPWDRIQTNKTATQSLIDESYEYLDGVLKGSIESEREEIGNTKIREGELETVKDHRLIDRRKIEHESKLDEMLIMLCFIFDINYPKTFEMIDREKIIDNIFKRFNFKDTKTKEEMKEINSEINKYIKKNKG